jgi:putative zinc finger/helix-turn-helix YgiT family protein
MAFVRRQGEFRFEPPPNVPGGDILVSDAEWEECEECGERVIAHALDQAIEQEARRRRGLLAPQEIKAVRERTGLSQEAMAQLIGVGAKSYTRWETGKSIQNKSNDNLIRLLDRNADKLLHLEIERRPNRQRELADYIANLPKLKGENRLGIAAHGGDLPGAVAESLRRRLRQLADSQDADQG